jgi:alpha-beta hydrolase superfamily lysophospholipase
MPAWVRRAALALAALSAAPPAAVLLLTTRQTWPGAEPVPADLPVTAEALWVDGYRLDGWWVTAPASRGVVVLLHGFAGKKSMMAERIRQLNGWGWTVLAVSVRGHGASDGWRTDIGVSSVADARAALALARTRAAGLPVIGWGVSMGGGLLLQLGPDADVDAIIAEAPYRDLRRALEVRVSAALPEQAAPWVTAVTAWWAWALIGVDPGDVSPARGIGALPLALPVLLVAGERDWKAPAADVAAMAERPGTKLLVVPEAGHDTLWRLRTRTVDEALRGFLEDRATP